MGFIQRDIMSGLFPKMPILPAAGLQTVPACVWVMPTPATRRRNYASLCKALPPGIPDCLQVSTKLSKEGSERCTAAVYGGRAYLIHYEFILAAV